jgi:hypothetical protein
MDFDANTVTWGLLTSVKRQAGMDLNYISFQFGVPCYPRHSPKGKVTEKIHGHAITHQIGLKR